MRWRTYNERIKDEAVQRVWRLAGSIKVCMFITWDGERQRARPLFSVPRQDEESIYFLTDAAGAKDEQVERFSKVCLAYADVWAGNFVVITGTAKVSDDRNKITSLWNAYDSAFWDSSEDPAIRLITVKPEDAELWDDPGTLSTATKLIGAALTGAKPLPGDNLKLDLSRGRNQTQV